MRGGSLRRPLTIQQGTPATSSEGDAELTWSTLTTAFADISPARGDQLLSAAQRNEKITHQVTIRYRTALPAPGALRFLYGTRAFYVKSIIDADERHRQLDCLCEELVLPSETGAD